MAKTREFLDMDDSFNTAAGWVLFAGIVALGTTIASGEYFHAEAPEKGGYAVADAAPAAGAAVAAKPINFAAGDPAKGAELFSKCASCHSIAAGGANGQGPNLHGIMGQKHGRTAGFAYSSGMMAMPGVWDWEAMDKWLTAPKKYVEGTKMAFAGLSNSEDRANLIRYINEQGSNMPVPAAPAAEAAPAAAGDAAAPVADAKAAAAAAK